MWLSPLSKHHKFIESSVIIRSQMTRFDNAHSELGFLRKNCTYLCVSKSDMGRPPHYRLGSVAPILNCTRMYTRVTHAEQLEIGKAFSASPDITREIVYKHPTVHWNKRSQHTLTSVSVWETETLKKMQLILKMSSSALRVEMRPTLRARRMRPSHSSGTSDKHSCTSNKQ